jgi:hypothetical protein
VLKGIGAQSLCIRFRGASSQASKLNGTVRFVGAYEIRTGHCQRRIQGFWPLLGNEGTHLIGIHLIDSFTIVLVTPGLDNRPRHVSKGLITKPVGLATDVLRDILPIDFALPKIPSPILTNFAKGVGAIH